MYRAESLMKRGDGGVALHGVSLRLEPGKITVLVAGSSIAASALVDILCGADREDSGTVSLDRERLGVAARRRSVAVARREPACIEELSVLDNLFLRFSPEAGLAPIDLRARLARAQDLLRRLSSPLDPAGTARDLSPSGRVLLDLSRALLAPTPVLILDRVGSFLDASQYEGLFSVLAEQVAGGRSVLFLTENLHDVDRCGGSPLLLAEGGIAALSREGLTPEELSEYTLPSEYARSLAAGKRFSALAESDATEAELAAKYLGALKGHFLMETVALVRLYKEETRVFAPRMPLFQEALENGLRKKMIASLREGRDAPMLKLPGARFRPLGRGGESSFGVITPEDAEPVAATSALFASLGEFLVGAALTLEKRRKDSAQRKDFELAGYIQQSILKRDFDGLPVAVHAVSQPARNVGGDFYELRPLPGGRLFAIIADVSGKGIAAGLVMMLIKGAVAAIPEAELGPARALADVSRVLLSELKGEKYATAFAVMLDPEAATIRYANAGHCEGLLLAPGGGTVILAEGGIPVGVAPDSKYAEHEVSASGASTLILYTDGVSEAFDPKGKEFGLDRLKNTLASHATMNPEALAEGVLGELRRFVGEAEQHDDITLLVIKAAR